MKIIADLHIHSKYSRGCSRDLTLENIAKWCDYKGISVVSTGDFTHPLWFKEIKDNLIPAPNNPGLYCLKNSHYKTLFILGTEISCIYTQNNKCRRIHLCLLMPDLESVEKLNNFLINSGCNLKSDGRPIIGLSAKTLTELAWLSNKNSFIFPAHAWTPWFSVFGSKSGFASLEECFEELTPKITAIETGLSSDPLMNRLVSALDEIVLISNSDAHSLINLGREANVFGLEEISYNEIISVLNKKNKNNFLYTIEFFPEEGKYHLDGHADCDFFCEPQDSLKLKNICPRCKKLLVLGVLNRVNELSDRKLSEIKDKNNFINIVPLQEIIAWRLGVNKNSKKVSNLYLSLVEKKSEFEILIDAQASELKEIMDQELVDLILAVRRGKVEIRPGFDGVYGKISIKSSFKNKN